MSEFTPYLKRIASSLEKLAETPILETEGGPPICPHCLALNPEISIAEADESRGPLGLFCLDAKCCNCNQTMFAVPIEWAIFKNVTDAQSELERRAGILNVDERD